MEMTDKAIALIQDTAVKAKSPTLLDVGDPRSKRLVTGDHIECVEHPAAAAVASGAEPGGPAELRQ